MSELPKIELHLRGDRFCRAGEAHLLCAFKDYKPMHEFFAKHFELWEPIWEDGFPTGYRMKVNGPSVREVPDEG